MNLNTLKTLLFSCILLYSYNFTHSAENLTSTGGGDAKGSSSTNPGQTSGTADGTATSTSANESSDQSSKLSHTSQDPNKKVTLLEINLKKHDVSTKFYQVRGMSRHSIYTSADGIGFNLIVNEGCTIWKAESDEKYSTTFVVEQNVSIKIHIEGGGEKIIKFLNGSWIDESHFTSLDNSKKTPFVLDLDQEKSSNQYEYTVTQDGKIKTYSVKDEHAIQQIRLLNSIGHCGRADRYIFKSKESIFYAKKAILIDLGSWKLFLFVELFNGVRLKFYRPAWGSQWKNKGVFPPSESIPVFVDINKQQSTNEIDYSKDGNTHVYKPKDGYCIESVRYIGSGGKLDCDIWIADHTKDYANKVEVTPDKINVYQFNGKSENYKLTQSSCCNWSCFFTFGIYSCIRGPNYTEDASVPVTNDADQNTKSSTST